jgi:predicted nucleic acid-binding protein
MAVLLDTSAILPVLNADDDDHPVATTQWETLLQTGEVLVVHNYVLVETLALVARRLGMGAVRAVQEDVVPAVEVEWVDPALHAEAVAAVLTAGRRDLSLVDCVSFGLMRRRGLSVAFAFDRHFREQGFRCLP